MTDDFVTDTRRVCVAKIPRTEVMKASILTDRGFCGAKPSTRYCIEQIIFTHDFLCEISVLDSSHYEWCVLLDFFLYSCFSH